MRYSANLLLNFSVFSSLFYATFILIFLNILSSIFIERLTQLPYLQSLKIDKISLSITYLQPKIKAKHISYTPSKHLHISMEELSIPFITENIEITNAIVSIPTLKLKSHKGNINIHTYSQEQGRLFKIQINQSSKCSFVYNNFNISQFSMHTPFIELPKDSDKFSMSSLHNLLNKPEQKLTLDLPLLYQALLYCFDTIEDSHARYLKNLSGSLIFTYNIPKRTLKIDSRHITRHNKTEIPSNKHHPIIKKLSGTLAFDQFNPRITHLTCEGKIHTLEYQIQKLTFSQNNFNLLATVYATANQPLMVSVENNTFDIAGFIKGSYSLDLKKLLNQTHSDINLKIHNAIIPQAHITNINTTINLADLSFFKISCFYNPAIASKNTRLINTEVKVQEQLVYLKTYSYKAGEWLDFKYDLKSKMGILDLSQISFPFPFSLGFKPIDEKCIVMFDTAKTCMAIMNDQIQGNIDFSDAAQGFIQIHNNISDGSFNFWYDWKSKFLSVTGKANYIDARPWMNDNPNEKKGIPSIIKIDADKILVSDEGYIKNAKIQIENRKGSSAAHIYIHGKAATDHYTGDTVHIRIKGKIPHRRIAIFTADAGGVCQAMGIKLPVLLGKLWIEGYINKDKSEGVVQVADFYTTKNLGLLHLIQLFSIGHWINIILQPNINYWRDMYGKWEYDPNIELTVSDIVMRNMHNYIFASGSVDFVEREVDFVGSIIPQSIWQRIFLSNLKTKAGMQFNVFGPFDDVQTSIKHSAQILPFFMP